MIVAGPAKGNWSLRNRSLMAGGGLGGVRPSSGAARIDKPYAPDFIASPLLPNFAAPEDGRTPLTSLPPSATHYEPAFLRLAPAARSGEVGFVKDESITL